MINLVAEKIEAYGSELTLEEHIADMREEMAQAARKLDFERAAVLRDKIKEYSKLIVFEM